MAYLNIDNTLNNIIYGNNRPLINILSLQFVMAYRKGDVEKEFSILLQSCFYFYKYCIDDPNIFGLLENLQGDLTKLPWRIFDPTRTWFFPGHLDHSNKEIKERNETIWLNLLDYWFDVFFQNPFFYLKWNIDDGWGWYHRNDYHNIQELLNAPIMHHHTFVESISEVEVEILKSFGFGSFFLYNTPGSQTSEWWIIFGFWMMGNSSIHSPLWFEHLYEFNILGDPDSIIGLPYRTMVTLTRRKWIEVNYMKYNYTMSIISLGR